MSIPEFVIRPANKNDLKSLANLATYQVYTHRHLDWFLPTDWVGRRPCLVIERDGFLSGALICPPDPPEIAWLRLFVVSRDISIEQAWDTLWSYAADQLFEQSCPPVAAITLQSWFIHLLEKKGFEPVQEIVTLLWEWSYSNIDLPRSIMSIRPMKEADLQSVYTLDMTAFGVLWRISQNSLRKAFQLSTIASVVEVNRELVGYQISTHSAIGGHLARLAVLPAYQGHGIGTALVQDVLSKFLERGIAHVTVNTQRDNLSSISVYLRAGFKFTSDIYPVFQYIWMEKSALKK